MKTEQIRKMGEDAIAKLAAELESQPSAALKKYLRAMASFRRYSISNLLLIFSQCPDATRVAGFHSWQRMGRHIKKGAKGIAILAPMVMRKKTVVVNGPDEDDIAEKEEEVVRYKPVYVWDVSMTEGKPLPEPVRVQGDPGASLQLLRDHVTHLGIKLEYGPTMTAEGFSLGGRIVLKLGLPPAQELSVLAHELAHERLHRNGEEMSRAMKETEAEAVAFAVCDAIGLSTGTSCSDYVLNWGGTKEKLLASMTRIRSVVAEILYAILDKPEETQQNMTASTAPVASAVAA